MFPTYPLAISHVFLCVFRTGRWAMGVGSAHVDNTWGGVDIFLLLDVAFGRLAGKHALPALHHAS